MKNLLDIISRSMIDYYRKTGIQPTFVVLNLEDFFKFERYFKENLYPIDPRNGTFKIDGCQVLRTPDLEKGIFKVG